MAGSGFKGKCGLGSGQGGDGREVLNGTDANARFVNRGCECVQLGH